MPVGANRVKHYGMQWDEQPRSYDGMTEEEEARARLIDDIADAVADKLRPVYHELISKSESGVLMGAISIGNYLKHWHRDVEKRSARGIRFTNSACIGVLVEKYGFPANKTPKGYWWVTKTAIDRWMHNRGMLMRKLKELGCVPRSGRHGVNGYAPPEYYKEEDVARAAREIIKDNVVKGI